MCRTIPLTHAVLFPRLRPPFTVWARAPALVPGPSPRKEVIIFSSAAPSCAEPIPSLDTTIHPHHPADVPATLPLLSPCLLVHLHRVRRHCLLRYWRRCTNLKESVLRYRLMDSHPTITPASAFSIPGKTHIVHPVRAAKTQCFVALIAYGCSERNSTWLG